MGSTHSLRGQLVRGGVGSAVVQVGSRLLTLTLGVVLARSLGADSYGVYTYAFALMTLVMVPAELGISTLLVREVAASEARQDWSYLRGVLIRSMQIVSVTSVTVSMIAALVLWQVGSDLLANQIQTLTMALLLVPLAVVTKAVSAALRGLRHVVKDQVVQMLIRPTLVLLVVSALFALSEDFRLPQNAMAVQVGVAIVVLCVAVILLFRYVPPAVRATDSTYETRQWLNSAVPLTLLGGAGIINSQTDIIMLGFFQPSGDVGVYRVAVQGATLVAFGLQAANTVVAPQFARLYAQGDRALLQRLVTASARVILLSALPVALVFILAGGTIVGWVFGAEFERSHTPLAILAAGQMINATMGSVGFLLNMTGHERDNARTLFITAVMNIFLNLILIPPFGMAGAASATAISLATWNILLCRLVMVRIGINSTAFTLKRH